jgi:hypothetical protein
VTLPAAIAGRVIFAALLSGIGGVRNGAPINIIGGTQ